MARISEARRTLQRAMIATTDPEERIRLATEINKLIAHEERVNGRTRRKRAKKAAAPKPPVDDSNEPFELDVYPAVSAPIKPDPLEAKRAQVEQETQMTTSSTFEKPRQP